MQVLQDSVLPHTTVVANACFHTSTIFKTMSERVTPKRNANAPVPYFLFPVITWHGESTPDWHLVSRERESPSMLGPHRWKVRRRLKAVALFLDCVSVGQA